MKISTQSYKGARDFYPEDMQIRNYIFSTWKRICQRFGYEEYDGPFLESFELYEAKSGEELVNEQLYSFIDRGERKVAIRPEMTPTLSRMIAAKHQELTKPIKWFSTPNLWRYEKPQKGRLREHYQLNVDTFGTTGIEADAEVISILINIMLEFGAKENMFEIKVNNRRLMEDVYNKLSIEKEKWYQLGKAIDKKPKISQEAFEEILKVKAQLTSEQIVSICQFLKNPEELINTMGDMSKGAREVKSLLKLLTYSNLDKYVKYNPTVMRGLDYYTGNVFELFDLNPENTRALSGGGRYDDLLKLFIDEELPGVGFGMGDVTMKEFLIGWDLLPEIQTSTEYLVTVWPKDAEKEADTPSIYQKTSIEVANILRNSGKNTSLWLESNTKLDKQLKYADKKGIRFVLIIGEQELKDKTITIKDLKTREQKTDSLEKFFIELQ